MSESREQFRERIKRVFDATKLVRSDERIDDAADDEGMVSLDEMITCEGLAEIDAMVDVYAEALRDVLALLGTDYEYLTDRGVYLADDKIMAYAAERGIDLDNKE